MTPVTEYLDVVQAISQFKVGKTVDRDDLGRIGADGTPAAGRLILSDGTMCGAATPIYSLRKCSFVCQEAVD
jgi:hypothetical protein